MNTESCVSHRGLGLCPAAVVLLATVALSGCFDSSSSSSGNTNGESNDPDYAEALASSYARVVVDASSYDQFTGLNLRTGEMTQNLEGDDWHIALQRYNNVLLNGSVLGAGSVSAALAEEQAAFYDGSGDPVENVFINATPDMYEADLTYPYVAADLNFESEHFLPAFGEWGEWSNYDHTSGGYVYADEDHFWVVRSTAGHFYAVQLINDGDALFWTRDGDATFGDAAITLSVTPLGSGGSFDLTSATEIKGELDDPRGSVYFDLDAGTVSVAETAGWDIRYSVETEASAMGTGAVGKLRLNGGVSETGNAALHMESPFTEAEVAALDDAGFGFAFESDSVDNVFTQNEWFRYGVGGGHRLSPNYRVFAVKLDDGQGDDIVLVQAIRYYHPESGSSGHVTLRARLLN